MINFEYFPNRGQCRITTTDPNQFQEIREHFSVKNTNAFFMKRRGMRFVKDRIYAMTPTGLFEPGMFYEIYRYVTSNFKDEVKYDDKIKQVIKPSLDSNALPFDNLSLKLRDYQIETVNQAIKFGRGIIKVGTGGGKTLTIASLISTFHGLNNKLKVLLIVPDLGLVNQTYNDFNSYNVPFKFTRWTGSIEPDITANVIIANIGILQSRFDEFPWLLNVDMLVVDECHKLKKGNKVCKLITDIKTNHKFGLTGTLPDNKVDEWNIIGLLGIVFYEKSSYDLRVENYLTNAEIKVLNIRYKDRVTYIQGVNKFRTELDFIYNNTFRNEVIKVVCDKCKNNVLILVNHLVHGDILHKFLTKHLPGRQVHYIRGEVEVEERARVISEMEKNDNVVCIAISAIFSTGVNVKNLHMVVFASGGKSFIRTIQSIGRGLRLNPNKEKLTIIDIADKLDYSAEHAARRQQIYTEEKIQYKTGEIVEK